MEEKRDLLLRERKAQSPQWRRGRRSPSPQWRMKGGPIYGSRRRRKRRRGEDILLLHLTKKEKEEENILILNLSSSLKAIFSSLITENVSVFRDGNISNRNREEIYLLYLELEYIFNRNIGLVIQ